MRDIQSIERVQSRRGLRMSSAIPPTHLAA